MDKKFENEKGLNLKKRLYDVLNIYIALGILSKKGKTFQIENAVPGKTKGRRAYQLKYDRLYKRIEEGVT